MAEGSEDDEGHGAPALINQCEVCFRELPEHHFPRSVLAPLTHQLLFPEVPRGRTLRSCKECRAQEVADRERIVKFLNFRPPDS